MALTHISHVPLSDEESDGPIGLTAPWNRKLLVQREVRSARFMSVGSLVLALASVAMMTRVALHSMGNEVAAAPADGIIGLSSSGAARVGTRQLGWYRTYLQGVVRRDMRLDSEKVQTLPEDSLVYVAEVVGRRARIWKPVEGWMSMETEDGIEILHPDGTYHADPLKVDVAEVLRSQKVREANERLQNSAIEMTALETRLIDALKKLNLDVGHVKGFGENVNRKSREFSARAPELGARLGQKIAAKAARVFGNTTHPQGILEKVAESPHLKKMVHGSKVEALVGPAVKHASAVRSELGRTRQSMAQFDSSMAELSEEMHADDQEFVTEVDAVGV